MPVVRVGPHGPQRGAAGTALLCVCAAVLEIAAGLFAMFLALGFCVLSPQRAGSLEADVCDVGDGLAAVVLAAVLPAIALVVSVTMLWRRELSKSAKVAAVLAPAVLALLVPAVVNLLPG